MRMMKIWALGTSIGLVGMAALLFVLYSLREDHSLVVDSAPESAKMVTVPLQEEITSFWNDQALKAEQAGQADVAAVYRARIAAHAAGVPSTLPLSASGTPALNPSASVQLYVRSASPAASAALAAPAKHEPVSGVYLGMLGADRRVGYDVNKIEPVYGRRHALYLAYVGWRKVQTDTNTYFPQRTAERVQALGGALQIGWEPRYGLDDVLDDEYVRRFAREAKASGMPIFLRYASEMNGAWVPWHDTPTKYIEKFRLIHDIMAEEAPNVAMVWSPNFWPPETIDAYYPGDAYVDWVGFSLYTSPILNGEEHFQGTLIDTFAPLYAKYSHKPIMISEGAVAHTSLKTNKSYWTWAEGQFQYMYGLLPRLFPQVKGITYFNFSRAQAQRTNGEFVYDIGENPYMDGLYQRMVQSNWFLSKVEPGLNPVPYRYTQLTGPSLPAGKSSVIAYPKLDHAAGEPPFVVALYQGKQRIGVSYEAPWEMNIQVDAAAASEPWYLVTFNEKLEPTAIGSGSAKP
ncbi:glycoside hydrolase family 26 protein [Paenibacillus sp. HJGM_3]|uniref:glycoside hydrolase family 26 protein n=1 Tax=Paenibacillus sp. HJGM_3 TaxID=3379816 RepID=UPI00385E6CAF